PRKLILPASGDSTPAISRSNVDLPPRRAPHTPVNTPSSISKDVASRTTISRGPSGYRLLTFSNDKRGVMVQPAYRRLARYSSTRNRVRLAHSTSPRSWVSTASLVQSRRMPFHDGTLETSGA